MNINPDHSGQQHSENPNADLKREIVRLWHRGFSVLPLGRGEKGQEPLRKFKDTERLPLENVLGAMYGHNKRQGSSVYGVRLSKLIVVDADTDNDETAAYIAKHFPTSTVQVKSPRGRHHYFALPEGVEVPNPVDTGNIVIDFKRGANSFVVGPESVRLDGGKYIADIGVLGETSLAGFVVLHPCEQPSEFRGPDSGNIYNNTPPLSSPSSSHVVGSNRTEPPEKPETNRNNRIFEFARDAAHHAKNRADLLARVRNENERQFGVDPLPDEEIEQVVCSVCGYRSTGTLWKGENSAVILPVATANDILAGPHGVIALALWYYLKAQHSARGDGATFAVNARQMAKARTLPMGRGSIINATKALVEVGAIAKVGSWKPKNHSQKYRLANGATQ